MKSILYPKETAKYIIGRLKDFRTYLEDTIDVEANKQKLDEQQLQLIQLLNSRYGGTIEALIRVNECISRLSANFEVMDDDFEFLNLIFSVEVN